MSRDRYGRNHAGNKQGSGMGGPIPWMTGDSETGEPGPGDARGPGMGRPAPGMRGVLGREDLGPERRSRGQHCGR